MLLGRLGRKDLGEEGNGIVCWFRAPSCGQMIQSNKSPGAFLIHSPRTAGPSLFSVSHRSGPQDWAMNWHQVMTASDC